VASQRKLGDGTHSLVGSYGVAITGIIDNRGIFRTQLVTFRVYSHVATFRVYLHVALDKACLENGEKSLSPDYVPGLQADRIQYCSAANITHIFLVY
jgi:hypothetical protein